jgi:hypothetical protein
MQIREYRMSFFKRDPFWILIIFSLNYDKKKGLTDSVRPEGKIGSNLLFHTLVCSTIGDKELDF